MERKKIDRIIEAFRNYMQLKEEIANVVGGGHIAGTPEADPDNPPVFPKKKKNIYLGIGSRKRWMNSK